MGGAWRVEGEYTPPLPLCREHYPVERKGLAGEEVRGVVLEQLTRVTQNSSIIPANFFESTPASPPPPCGQSEALWALAWAARGGWRGLKGPARGRFHHLGLRP